MPFWPGGLEDASAGIPEELEDGVVAEGKGIRTIPPGFTRGLRLPGEEEDEAGLVELDNIQRHPAVGGDVVSTTHLKPYLLDLVISLRHLPRA